MLLDLEIMKNNFLGVWRQLNDLNTTSHFLISKADWARDVEKISSSRRAVSIDVCQFVFAAQSYWGSEILSVGFMVLEKLKAIFYCPRFSELLFCRSKILITVHEIVKLILELKVLKLGHHDRKTLLEFTRLATENFVSNIFPICWWKSLTEYVAAFRRTEACKDLLMHVVAESFRSKKGLSYEKIANTAIIVLGSGKLHKELNKEISKSLEGKPAWKVFLENQHRLREVNDEDGSTHALELVTSFREALEDVYNVHGRKFNDCMSPCSFLYLVERLMIWSSSVAGYFFSTRSSFVEWFFFNEFRVQHSSRHKLEDWCLPAINLMTRVVQDCLHNNRYVFELIKRSTKTDYYTEVLLRFVVMTLLLYANFGERINPFVVLLRTGYITEQLPLKVRVALEGMAEGESPSTKVNLFVEILKQINDPMVIGSLENECPLTCSSDVIAVDLKGSYCSNNVLRIPFPEKIETPKVSTGASTIESGESSTVPSETQSKHNGNSTSKKNNEGRQG